MRRHLQNNGSKRGYDRICAAIALALVFVASVASTFIDAAEQGIFQDGIYHVKSKTVVRVEKGPVAILVEDFNMGSKSAIELSPATPLFVVHARRATVGNSARIVGKGRNGESRNPNGRPGPTIVVIFEDIHEVRGLTIAALGGDGVDGSKGPDGSDGRPAQCMFAEGTNGRPGGDGGDGGNSGDGGRIYLILPQHASGYGITMITAPGEVGRKGPPGRGGAGGRGKVCLKFPFKVQRSGGRDGPDGNPGSPGTPGNPGNFMTLTFDPGDKNTLVDQLDKIDAILREGGREQDAQTLRALLRNRLLNVR